MHPSTNDCKIKGFWITLDNYVTQAYPVSHIPAAGEQLEISWWNWHDSCWAAEDQLDIGSHMGVNLPNFDAFK